MKLTQNDIATIEQAHDYLLDKVKLRFDTPLLERLRKLSGGIIKKMDNIDDTLFILSKKEIHESYKSPEKLKQFAKDAFELEIKKGQWYRIEYLESVLYIYITEFIAQNEFNCFGFDNNQRFFKEDDNNIVKGAKCTKATDSQIINLFKKEYSKRDPLPYDTRWGICFTDGFSFSVDNKVVFKNGIWLNQDNDINELVNDAKKLEQKHGLKITLTFE